MFIEPTITWVPSGFSGYIWLDTKIVLKKKNEASQHISLNTAHSGCKTGAVSCHHLHILSKSFCLCSHFSPLGSHFHISTELRYVGFNRKPNCPTILACPTIVLAPQSFGMYRISDIRPGIRYPVGSCIRYPVSGTKHISGIIIII